MVAPSVIPHPQPDLLFGCKIDHQRRRHPPSVSKLIVKIKPPKYPPTTSLGNRRKNGGLKNIGDDYKNNRQKTDSLKLGGGKFNGKK